MRKNNYYAAIRAYSQSRYDYLTNVLTLKQQAGRLTRSGSGSPSTICWWSALMSLRAYGKPPVIDCASMRGQAQ
jgi:hypothetical protein